MNDIYYKIGEVFTFEGKDYVCKENKDKKAAACMSCAFKNSILCPELDCFPGFRKDGKDVYYEEIKNRSYGVSAAFYQSNFKLKN